MTAVVRCYLCWFCRAGRYKPVLITQLDPKTAASRPVARKRQSFQRMSPEKALGCFRSKFGAGSHHRVGGGDAVCAGRRSLGTISVFSDPYISFIASACG
jgi:hypothetical protein